MRARSTPRQSPVAGFARDGIVVALAGVALAGAIGGAILFARYAARVATSPDRVSVAPFDVFVPGLEQWRVDLAEALTRRLPGAVPQQVVVRTWRAHPEVHPAIAALELARQTRAGVAVYGRVDPAAGDSVSVRLAVMDAAAARLLFEVEARDARGGGGATERLADSLAARIERGLATTALRQAASDTPQGPPR